MRSAIVALAVGCYQPSPHSGAPCGSSAECPAPLVCAPTGTCETTAIDAPPSPDAPGSIDGPSRDAPMVDAPTPRITWRATTTQFVVQAGAMSITIAAPATSAGDVMVATLAIGNTGEALPPAFTPPDASWALIRQIDRNNDTAVAIYWHVATPAEAASYTWTFNERMEGVAWISAYAGVSTTSPVDADDGIVISTVGLTYAAPSIATTVPDTMLMATFATHDGGTPTTWTAPAGTQTRAALNNGTTRAGLGVELLFGQSGATPSLTATASTTQGYAIVHVLALRPKP